MDPFLFKEELKKLIFLAGIVESNNQTLLTENKVELNKLTWDKDESKDNILPVTLKAQNWIELDSIPFLS